VVVGSGVQLGHGDDMTPNQQLSDRLNTGITVVGKGAHIPASICIGRNVLIDADVDEADFALFGDNVVPSGASVAPGPAEISEEVGA